MKVTRHLKVLTLGQGELSLSPRFPVDGAMVMR